MPQDIRVLFMSQGNGCSSLFDGILKNISKPLGHSGPAARLRGCHHEGLGRGCPDNRLLTRSCQGLRVKDFESVVLCIFYIYIYYIYYILGYTYKYIIYYILCVL